MVFTVSKQIQYSKQNPRRQKTPPGVFQSKEGSVEYVSMMMQEWPDYNWKSSRAITHQSSQFAFRPDLASLQLLWCLNWSFPFLLVQMCTDVQYLNCWMLISGLDVPLVSDSYSWESKYHNGRWFLLSCTIIMYLYLLLFSS